MPNGLRPDSLTPNPCVGTMDILQLTVDCRNILFLKIHAKMYFVSVIFSTNIFLSTHYMLDSILATSDTAVNQTPYALVG